MWGPRAAPVVTVRVEARGHPTRRVRVPDRQPLMSSSMTTAKPWRGSRGKRSGSFGIRITAAIGSLGSRSIWRYACSWCHGIPDRYHLHRSQSSLSPHTPILPPPPLSLTHSCTLSPTPSPAASSPHPHAVPSFPFPTKNTQPPPPGGARAGCRAHARRYQLEITHDSRASTVGGSHA